ncbi:MAG TPA: prolyl oligopeptidase family serine peptidase [Opitutaceae bacterium]
MDPTDEKPARSYDHVAGASCHALSNHIAIRRGLDGSAVSGDPLVSRRRLAQRRLRLLPATAVIVHGDADRTVPLSQSQLLVDALRRVNAAVELHVIPGAGHGDEAFRAPEIDARVQAFFDRHLKRP